MVQVRQNGNWQDARAQGQSRQVRHVNWRNKECLGTASGKNETTTASECLSSFSNLRTAKIVSHSVQKSHRTGGIKLGTAHRGFGHGTMDFWLVLDVQQVGLNQPGLDDSDLEISVAVTCHEFKSESELYFGLMDRKQS